MELVKVGTKNIPVVPQRHARLRASPVPIELPGHHGAGGCARESYRVLGMLIPALPDAIPLAVGRVRLSGGHGLWALRRGRRQQPDDGGDRRHCFEKALIGLRGEPPGKDHGLGGGGEQPDQDPDPDPDSTLARLAWKEWGVNLDEFWSEEPGCDRERGITVPRIGLPLWPL